MAASAEHHQWNDVFHLKNSEFNALAYDEHSLQLFVSSPWINSIIVLDTRTVPYPEVGRIAFSDVNDLAVDPANCRLIALSYGGVVTAFETTFPFSKHHIFKVPPSADVLTNLRRDLCNIAIDPRAISKPLEPYFYISDGLSAVLAFNIEGKVID